MGDAVYYNDSLVQDFIATLRTESLFPLHRQPEDIFLATDTVIGYNGTIYLVKPLVRRFWLRGQAFNDAARVVDFVRREAFA